MIVFCDEIQRKQALAMWKQTATTFEVATSEFRLQRDWLECDVVGHVQDFNINAFLLEQSKAIRCKDHVVSVMFCPWLVKGNVSYADLLLSSRLKMHACHSLASIIVSDEVDLLRAHHAKPWVVTQTITLSKSMIESKSYAMVTFECPIEMVMRAYESFTQRFEAAIVPTQSDFVLNTGPTKLKRKRAGIIEDERMLGYMDYELTPYCCDIKILVYEDVDTLLRLLSFAASMHHHIVIHTSSAERFEKLYPQAIIVKKVKAWIVLHHPALWSELFKQQVESVEDVVRILQKPVMMHIE